MAFCMVYLLYQLQEVIFYDGKQSGQIQKVILDIDSMVLEDYLLRRIKTVQILILYTERQSP